MPIFFMPQVKNHLCGFYFTLGLDRTVTIYKYSKYKNMKQFTQMELFSIIGKSSRSNFDASRLKNAYDEFACRLLSEGIATPDKPAFHQTLCYTHAELTSLRSSWMRKVEKNKAIIWCLDKALQLVYEQMVFMRQQLLPYNAAVFKQTEISHWKSGQMELVELVYALCEAGCFGKTPLKNLFAIIGKMFGCEITNNYRLFWDIRNRASENRAFFLKKLTTALSDKLNRMDGGARS